MQFRYRCRGHASGVDWQLAGRKRRFGNQSWFDPYGTTSPGDNNGHGTHTMGIMVGRDGADTIGVAFSAAWISAAVVDRGQTLSKTVSDILRRFSGWRIRTAILKPWLIFPMFSAIPGAFRAVCFRHATRRSIRRLTISRRSASW